MSAAESIKGESDLYAMALGRIVASLREEQGLNQTDFAAAVGMTQPTLSRLEHGRHMPDAYRLQVVAQVLGLTADDLHERVQRALAHAENTSKAAVSGSVAGDDEWWLTVLKTLGMIALGALVVVGVAAALSELGKGGKPKA